MSQELIQAVMVLTKQKGFAPEVIFESLEAALLQAYRKEPTSNPDAYVVIDRETGVYKVMAKKQVVETVELPETEISLLDARKKDKRCMSICFAVWAALRPKLAGVTSTSTTSPISKRLSFLRASSKLISVSGNSTVSTTCFFAITL